MWIQPNWEDYYDLDLVNFDFLDKILSLNSVDVLDIIHQEKTFHPMIINNLKFCPKCGSAIILNNRIIYCKNCGYLEHIKIDKNELMEDIKG